MNHIVWVFCCLPGFVRYVNSLPNGEQPSIGKWQALGEQRSWFALVLRGRERDKGILAHEVTHVKQWYLMTTGCLIFFALMCVFLSWVFSQPLLLVFAVMTAPAGFISIKMHGWCYRRFAQYRQYAEVNAFAHQLGFYPQDDTDERRDARFRLFAFFLTLNVYRLGIDQEQAQALLSAKIKNGS